MFFNDFKKKTRMIGMEASGRWILALCTFIQFIHMGRSNGNCIESSGSNSELAICNTVNVSMCMRTHGESGDNQTVTRHLHMNKSCVRESHVRIMALVSGQYDCVRQEFLFVHHKKSDCSVAKRCQTKNVIPYGSNTTVCLLKCPRDQSSDGTFGVQLIFRNKQRNLELCGLETYQVDWIQPNGWTGPETIFYRSFDTPDQMALMEGIQGSNFAVLVPGVINSAIATDRTKRQWIDLGIHTEACITRPESCGAAGGAISVWLRLNECPNWAGIISTFSGSGTGLNLYCRHPELLRYTARIQDGRFQLQPNKPSGWTHVVLNYIGPNTGEGIRIYYNGVGVGTDRTKWNDSLTSGDGRIVVGRYYTERDQSYASVQVDELVFFNQCLKTEEVRKLHSAI